AGERKREHRSECGESGDAFHGSCPFLCVVAPGEASAGTALVRVVSDRRGDHTDPMDLLTPSMRRAHLGSPWGPMCRIWEQTYPNASERSRSAMPRRPPAPV